MATVYKRKESPYFYARIRDPREPAGERRISTLCRDRRAAEDFADAEQAKTDLEIEGSDGLRWLDAADHFLQNADLKDQTLRGYTSLTSVVTRSTLGNFNLKLLSHDDIRRFVKERREAPVLVYNRSVKSAAPTRRKRKVSDASIRRSLSLISSVIDWAIERDLHGAPAENVMKTFDRSRLKESRIVDRHLRPAQFVQVLNSLKNQEHRRILITLVGTGMRSSELLTLTWTEVDFDSRVIEFGNLDPGKTKNSRARRIPMSSEVYKALLAQRTAQKKDAKRYRKLLDTPFVFPNRLTGEPRSHLGYLGKRVKHLTGLNSYRNHDLRHTFGSWAIQQGIDLIATSLVMGHSTLAMTSRYARHVDDSVAAQFHDLRLPVSAHKTAHSSGLTEKRSRKGRE